MSTATEPAADLDPRRTSSPLSTHDLPYLGGIIALAIWFAVDSAVMPPPLEMDGKNYIAIAEDPSAASRVAGIHAQRILPPLLARVFMETFGLTVVAAFRALSIVAYVLFLTLFYCVLRHGGVCEQLSLGTTVFCGISAWPMTYSLGNVYQACDGMAYPFGLAMVALTLKRKPFALLVVSLLGVMTRQQLLVLALAAFVHLYVATGRWQPTAYALAVSLAFGLVVVLTGPGDGPRGLADHTIVRILDFGSLARGLIATKLPVMLSPFLLVLVVFARQTWAYAKRYWWVTLFVAVTMAQPLFALPMTGASNAQRLGMIGAWVCFWPAALILRDELKSRWAVWCYAALPLFYGTQHLTHLRHTYPSPVGHRSVVNVMLLALVLADRYWGRGGRSGAGDQSAGRSEV